MREVINSVQNALVKRTANLLQKKYRDAEGLFLLEGFKNVWEALASNYVIEHIFIDEKNIKVNDLAKLEEIALAKSIDLVSINDTIIKKISDVKTHQPIVAVVRKQLTLLKDLQVGKDFFAVILDELKDPGNVGTIIRTADAVAIDAIILTQNSVELFSPKVLRSTMGSFFHLPIVADCSHEEILVWLQENNVQLFVTAADAQNSIYKTEFSGACAVAIGSESHGVSEVLDKASAKKVSIPMKGKAESLNAAVAASLIIYKARGNC